MCILQSSQKELKSIVVCIELKTKKIHLFESHTAMYYNPFENSNLNFQPICYMYIVNLCSVVKFYIKL